MSYYDEASMMKRRLGRWEEPTGPRPPDPFTSLALLLWRRLKRAAGRLTIREARVRFGARAAA